MTPPDPNSSSPERDRITPARLTYPPTVHTTSPGCWYQVVYVEPALRRKSALSFMPSWKPVPRPGMLPPAEQIQIWIDKRESELAELRAVLQSLRQDPAPPPSVTDPA